MMSFVLKAQQTLVIFRLFFFLKTPREQNLGSGSQIAKLRKDNSFKRTKLMNRSDGPLLAGKPFQAGILRFIQKLKVNTKLLG